MIRRVRYMRIATVIVWSAIILLAVSTALFLPTLQTIDSRYIVTTDQMHRLEQSGVITKAVDVMDLQKRTRAIKDKLASSLPASPMQYINHIRTYEGSGIRLIGYGVTNADKPIVEVHGVATTRQNLQQFIATLQADSTIATVDSPVTNFVKSSQSEFTITITFKTV